MLNRQELIDKYLYEDILPEMFKSVSAPTDNIREFVKADNWYWLHSWTKEQESEFINWLGNYFKTKKKTFHLFGKSYLRNNKENRLRLASNFVAQFGWKVDKI